MRFVIESRAESLLLDVGRANAGLKKEPAERRAKRGIASREIAMIKMCVNEREGEKTR